MYIHFGPEIPLVIIYIYIYIWTCLPRDFISVFFVITKKKNIIRRMVKLSYTHSMHSQYAALKRFRSFKKKANCRKSLCCDSICI